VPFCSPAELVIDIEQMTKTETNPVKHQALITLSKEAYEQLVELDKKDTLKTRRRLQSLHAQALLIIEHEE
jgi:hypothetical protein